MQEAPPSWGWHVTFISGLSDFLVFKRLHFVRRVFGPRMQRLLPLSALFGGAFLAVAQIVAAKFLPEVGVGVICAIFGGPFILWLLASRRNGEGRDV